MLSNTTLNKQLESVINTTVTDNFVKKSGDTMTGNLSITASSVNGSASSDSSSAAFHSGQVKAGDKAALFTNTEGGNLRLTSPGGQTYEFDAYNGDLRVVAPGGKSIPLIYKNGTTAWSKIASLENSLTSIQTRLQTLENNIHNGKIGNASSAQYNGTMQFGWSSNNECLVIKLDNDDNKLVNFNVDKYGIKWDNA